MQLSAYADPDQAVWDIAVDGRWLGDGPGGAGAPAADAATANVLEFPPFDPAQIGSARLLAVWLTNGETYTLSALRPQGAKGQDRDEISVALPEAQAALQVFDPRLSTEYSAAGVPRRFGVELWLGEDAEGEQHPLRLAGEARSGDQIRSDGPVSAHAMRAHSSGIPGIGVYVLVQP